MAVSAPVVNPDLQVMSAQAEGALLRKDEGRAQRCDEAGAEETGAVGSGAPVLAGVSDPLQMNGKGGDQGERGAGETWVSDPDPAEDAAVDDPPRGSGDAEVQRSGGEQEAQAGTDIGAHGASSGAVFAATLPERTGPTTATYSGEQVSGSFFTPRSARGAPPRGEGYGPQSSAWPGWITKLGDIFKAPAVSWMPSPLPSPPRPRRLLEAGPPPQRGWTPGMGNGLGFRVDETRAPIVPPTYNTPSSSSLPAEAIQAEVQRQLGGLLDRLLRGALGIMPVVFKVMVCI